MHCKLQCKYFLKDWQRRALWLSADGTKIGASIKPGLKSRSPGWLLVALNFHQTTFALHYIAFVQHLSIAGLSSHFAQGLVNPIQNSLLRAARGATQNFFIVILSSSILVLRGGFVLFSFHRLANTYAPLLQQDWKVQQRAIPVESWSIAHSTWVKVAYEQCESKQNCRSADGGILLSCLAPQ